MRKLYFVVLLLFVSGSIWGQIDYYSLPAGNLTDTLTWGQNMDGSGLHPPDFTTAGQIFNVVNRTSVTLDADWLVSGGGSKVIVGDNVVATTLILPVNAALTGKIDVSDFSLLQIINTILPTFGTLQAGSTVEYAQTAATFSIPTGDTYDTLKLTGKVKTFGGGTITVNTKLVVDGVTGFNGAGGPFTTLRLAGDFTLQNLAAFEPIATGDANRMTITCFGSGTQTFSGGDFYFTRLQTPLPSGAINIVLSSANLFLGNSSTGGLNLSNANHTLTIGSDTLTIRGGGFFTSTELGTLSGSTTSNLIIDKTINNATAIGSIGFTPGFQVLNNLSHNCTSGVDSTLHLLSPVTVSGTLALNVGKIDVGANDLTSYGTITGGSNTAYVQTSSSGVLKLGNVTNTRNAPIGNSTYNPLVITNTDGDDWSLLVEDVVTVYDPLFAANAAHAVQREWHITPSTIPTVTGTNIIFQWDESFPAEIGPIYNPAALDQIWREVPSGSPWGPDWIAVGVSQAASVAGSVRTVFINNWTLFSDFAVSNMDGPLPIKLVDFNVVKVNGSMSNITWELADYCFSAARFDIEKSADAHNWALMTTVPGSETNRFYNLNDSRLGKGITYYRLKMIDVDGKTSYSKIIAVINDIKGLLITSMAPNPVHDQAILSVSTAKQGPVSFSIYDMSGKLMKQWNSTTTEGTNNITINTSELPAGVYQLTATTVDTNTMYRFVKQ